MFWPKLRRTRTQELTHAIAAAIRLASPEFQPRKPTAPDPSLSRQIADGLTQARLTDTGARKALFWTRIGTLASVISLIGFVSVFLAVGELQESRKATELSAAALQQQANVMDRSFVSSIRVSVDSSRLKVSNDSATQVTMVAIWLVAIDDDTAYELEGAIRGIPGCSGLSVAVDDLVASSTPDDPSAPKDAWLKSQSAIRSAFAAVEAPSGAWFLISDGGTVDPIDVNDTKPEDETESLSSGPDINAVLDVLQSSRQYLLGPDTYLEGVSFYYRYQLDGPVGAGEKATGYAVPAMITRLGCDAIRS